MRIFYSKKILFLSVFIIFFSYGEAQAHHCHIQSKNIAFGKVDPLRIQGLEALSQIQLNCYSVSSPTHYCIVLRGSESERLLKHGQDEIPFNFYHDNRIFGGDGVGAPVFGTIEPIRGQSSQHPIIPFSAMLGRPGGLNLQTGAYTGKFTTEIYGAYGRDSLTDAEKQAMCRGQRPSGLSYWTDKPQTFTVSANVEKSCSVAAANINFGKVTELASVKDTSGVIKVKCSAPTNYQIGLSLGDNSPGRNRRAMKCANAALCKSALVSYNLYQDAGFSRIWNSEWGTEGTAKGFSANQTQSADFFAQVTPGQSSVPNGIYQDRIRVEVRWD